MASASAGWLQGLAETLVEQGPPAPVRALEARLLARVFARAFGTRPPLLRGLTDAQALEAFQNVTAAQMERALALRNQSLALPLRARLGEGALALGRQVRHLVPGAATHPMEVARYLYRGIDIELAQTESGLRFGPCSFARRYTPRDCWFMSAFDEGFLRGITGEEEARLAFSCRITEGAPCCKARFQADAESVLAEPTETGSVSRGFAPTESISEDLVSPDCQPTKSAPGEAVPTDSLPTRPALAEAVPTGSLPTESVSTGSSLIDCVPACSSSMESVPTEPVSTEPDPHDCGSTLQGGVR